MLKSEKGEICVFYADTLSEPQHNSLNRYPSFSDDVLVGDIKPLLSGKFHAGLNADK